MEKVKNFLINEILLFLSIFIFLVLAFFNIITFSNIKNFIDIKTIVSLSGLIIVVASIKESGFLSYFSNKILIHIKKEKTLVFILISLSIFLSSFLTNDISLFIIVPLTFEFERYLQSDIKKIIIFEAIAVNIGSSLTPIGNPQNLYLWNNFNLQFKDFVFTMFFQFTVSTILLFIFIFFIFKNKDIKYNGFDKNYLKYDKILFFISFLLLIIFIISIEYDYSIYGLCIIIVIFLGKDIINLILRRKIDVQIRNNLKNESAYKKLIKDSCFLCKIDWGLLFLIFFIIIDFRAIQNYNIIKNVILIFNLNEKYNVFLISAIISQFVSNVPATVLMHNYSNNFKAIAYGVNIGGNGLIIASFANLIALRLYKSGIKRNYKINNKIDKKGSVISNNENNISNKNNNKIGSKSYNKKVILNRDIGFVIDFHKISLAFFIILLIVFYFLFRIY